MGLILSRFRRKKTTTEVLEQLETKIKRIEKDGEYKEKRHKRVLGYIMSVSVGLYVLFALMYYYMYVGRSQYWLHSVMYASPLLLLPVLVILLRSTVSWYYRLTLDKNRKVLNEMREEKKKILEQVMNTETYKIAKEILDKYGNPEGQMKSLKPFVPSTTPSIIATSPPETPVNLRQRQLMQTSTPNNKIVPLMNNTTMFNGARIKMEQLPRPLPERNRSALDKVVDYLLKDGPNYRMALICTECYSHNGMAMIEEFEFVSYKCAYCGRFNPARKQRPTAPALSPLKALTLNNNGTAFGSDESSVASSGSDTEDEKNVETNLIKVPGPDNESDRPPSPTEVEPKSEIEKKQD
ncbi:endoplasmic reticulum junction formation protein lunapark-A [Leptidea sinapis]|uniref:endoplasmic reticulum junction formation protein lunapark-A n=1 Tax=Leptidea sinapis TaxID=189913 RepID=UPI0021205942|nr:endoplasmic reticulum junction formation protein lunapark-A [Leptidea sinapis]